MDHQAVVQFISHIVAKIGGIIIICIRFKESFKQSIERLFSVEYEMSW